MEFQEGDRVRWIGRSNFGVEGTVVETDTDGTVRIRWDDIPDDVDWEPVAFVELIK